MNDPARAADFFGLEVVSQPKESRAALPPGRVPDELRTTPFTGSEHQP